MMQHFRRGPLYTYSSKVRPSGTLTPKVFSEEQANAQYMGRNDKATFDPFTGMQMWSERYVPEKRYLPDMKGACWGT